MFDLEHDDLDDELDYSTLTPGIREVVRLLRKAEFHTMDSGDGVTNVAAGMEGAIDIPHVHCRIAPDELVTEPHRLLKLLHDAVPGFSKGALDDVVEIQAMYSPIDRIATISLYGLKDEHLRKP